MRILFWSETFWPRVGGVENLAAKLLPALRAQGHEFLVVTWETTDFPDVIHYQGIPIYRFPFFTAPKDTLKSMMENRRRVARLKQDFAPELVHINSYGRSVLFHVNTRHACRAPVLVTLHQALPDEPVGRDTLLGNLLRTAEWVTACSESVLAHTRRRVPEIARRSSLVYNGLDVSSVDPGPMVFDPPRLLCLGRLVADKGFDLALSAFATVLDRFPRARLAIAGDGPERERLEQQAIRLGLADSVEFLGGVSAETAAHWIERSTLVVIPSRREGFGLVALEAALMARPVVATRVGGLPEVVAHEQTGLLVESENDRVLADAIAFLLNHPETGRKLGQAARTRAQRMFGLDRCRDAYDALYRRLGEGKRPGGSDHSVT